MKGLILCKRTQTIYIKKHELINVDICSFCFKTLNETHVLVLSRNLEEELLWRWS